MAVKKIVKENSGIDIHKTYYVVEVYDSVNDMYSHNPSIVQKFENYDSASEYVAGVVDKDSPVVIRIADGFELTKFISKHPNVQLI